MKTNTKKSALVVSFILLLLCVTMLIGTTFAWFTDTASTSVNQIIAGNLDVEMKYLKPGDTQWKKVDSSTKLFDSTGWEPGYTQVVYIQIENVGTLALKHAIAMNIIGESTTTNVAGEKMRLSDYLQVDLREVDSDITKLATSRSQLGIDTSVSSSKNNLKAFNSPRGILLSGEAKTYQLTIYMPTTVGNEANYRGNIAPAITFGIKATASQATYEKDSFDDQYDVNAPVFISVSDKKEFENAFASAKAGEDLYVSLENDIDLGSGFVRIIREKFNNQVGVGIGNIIIDGNGYKIYTNHAQSSGVINIEYSDSNRSITIMNAKIMSNATNGTTDETRGIVGFEVENGTINLIGCTIETSDTQKGVGLKLLRSKNLTLNLTDCFIRGAVAIEITDSANCQLNLTDCILESNYDGAVQTRPDHIVEENSTNITCTKVNTVCR